MRPRSAALPGEPAAGAVSPSQQLREALALHRSGQLDQARSLCEQIVRRQPLHDAYQLLAIIAAQTADPNRAVALFDKAIALNPRHAANHCNRGFALLELGRVDAAVASFERAIALDARCASAHLGIGMACRQQSRYRAALRSYDRVLELEPHCADAHFNRGNVLSDLEQFESAIASYDSAIAIRPDNAEAHANRADALRDLLRLDEAAAAYDRAIAARPQYPEAHAAKGTLLLLRGDLAQGWREYEWRLNVATGVKTGASPQGPPRWRGDEPIGGKTILLQSEQGLGDTLQFCRYASLLADRGANVILQAQKPLLGVLRTLRGVSRLVPAGGALPGCDYYCPLLSVPLGVRTTLDGIPADTPYLSSEAERRARWRARLGSGTGPRVGLVWSGNPRNPRDIHRSVPLNQLLHHLPPGITYVSLKKDLTEADRRTLRARPEVLNLADEQQDFRDTAALCDCLDLTLSVDTSVAHLSGALGRRTWILLSARPDFRWLLHGESSPWYPSARLYRQATPGDWEPVLARVAAELPEALSRQCLTNVT